MRRSLFAFVLVLLVSFFFPVVGYAKDFSDSEIIVKLRLPEFLEKFKEFSPKKLLLDNTFVLKVPKGQAEKFVNLYKFSPFVEYAEQDYIAEALLTVNDPYFGKQWGMNKISASSAWDLATGSPNIKIAILDSGTDEDHEDLLLEVAAKVNMTSSPTTNDLYGHGTHVAGIAAALTNNGLGVAGVGFNSSLMNVKVLDDQGFGYYSWIANGITWAANNGAKVINMSLGGSFPSKTLQNAIDYAWRKGVLLACAAGNNGNKQRVYPAYYQNCMAVAATDENDKKTSFSTYGTWVDVAAPGVNIFSSFPNHPFYIGTNYGRSQNYDYGSGTSMATPHVAGLAGLVFGKYPSFSNSQVRQKIESTADRIYGTGTYWTKGRINAFKALSN